MLAFAYEQCHLLEEAEATARYALQLLPSEPWAQHALAHVLLTRGREVTLSRGATIDVVFDRPIPIR